jgi:hypothetical protein
MTRTRIASWLGAFIYSGLIIHSPVEAGGMFGWFSHHASCDRPAEPVCQQQCQCPPKKKKSCCFCPPEPPQAIIGTSVAADSRAQLADTNPQDERLNKLDKDLNRLSVIVEKLSQQSGGLGGNAAPALTAPHGNSNPPGEIPPVPAATKFEGRRSPAIQQVSMPNSNVATPR